MNHKDIEEKMKTQRVMWFETKYIAPSIIEPLSRHESTRKQGCLITIKRNWFGREIAYIRGIDNKLYKIRLDKISFINTWMLD